MPPLGSAPERVGKHTFLSGFLTFWEIIAARRDAMSWLYWIPGFVLFGLLGSTASLAVSASGQPDPYDIYIVIATPADADALAPPEQGRLREIGVVRAPLSRMVWADTSAHKSLVQSGFWVLPASRLAALCGVDTGIAKGI